MNRRSWVTLIILALGAGVGLARTVVAQQAVQLSPDSTPPRRVAMPARVEVPLVSSNLPGARLPVVEIYVNGRGPFRFGIETGAGFVGVSRAFVEKAGLTRNGGSDEYAQYHVDSITIGGASFHDLNVTSMPRAASGVDGILGLPFFHDVLLTVDYPAARARFERDTLPVANGRDILPLSRIGPFWGLPLEIAGTRFDAVLDTRSMTAVSISPEIAARLSFESEPRVVGRAGGAGIPTTEIKAAQLRGEVKLGQYRFPRPTLVVHELPPGFPSEPLVGTAVLKNFVMSLDQRTRRLRLAHEGSPIIELPAPAPTRAAAAGPAAAGASASALGAFVGRYGERDVTLSGDTLFIQRPGGPKLALVLRGLDVFGLSEVPAARFEFVRGADGSVIAVRVLNREGQWERAERTP